MSLERVNIIAQRKSPKQIASDGEDEADAAYTPVIKDVVLVLCGGNIDLTILDRVIEIGLVADGRLSRFTVSISDRPGGLARLAEVIASTGASIKEILHDRAFSGPDMSEVRVVCVVETTGHDHVAKLHRALADAKVAIVAST